MGRWPSGSMAKNIRICCSNSVFETNPRHWSGVPLVLEIVLKVFVLDCLTKLLGLQVTVFCQIELIEEIRATTMLFGRRPVSSAIICGPTTR